MNTVLQKYRIDTVITACRLVYTYEVRIACDCMHSHRLLKCIFRYLMAVLPNQLLCPTPVQLLYSAVQRLCESPAC
jgi:hypothetical protein